MRVVQFEIPQVGRRLGIVSGDQVLDLTSVEPAVQRVVDAFRISREQKTSLNAYLKECLAKPGIKTLSYEALLEAPFAGEAPFLHPPVDDADPHRVLITGTGLTHTGSVKSRDEMHRQEGTNSSAAEKPAAPQTDSAKMFQMGIEGGKPPSGERGVAPEWFFKGTGLNLVGTQAPLELPAFALDGGEEPELVGCYIIDDNGVPCRLGFTLGNEWSDHATEKINYLYLAPSKLRTCAVGPELNTEFDFQNVALRCTVWRNGEEIYDSGELFSGEKAMCHSLANMEDHHFKYPQHRHPGDIHLHFFGTSKLSYSTRTWKYQPGDKIRIEAPRFSGPLINRVTAGDERYTKPVAVEPA
ncbi:MAG: GguC family protein [Planctomycetota bacterium]|nr:GguC family protein [Planctomycetota bacterium]MDA1214415.1 GguC family protein [Planctomycetota bacterium]